MSVALSAPLSATHVYLPASDCRTETMSIIAEPYAKNKPGLTTTETKPNHKSVCEHRRAPLLFYSQLTYNSYSLAGKWVFRKREANMYYIKYLLFTLQRFTYYLGTSQIHLFSVTTRVKVHLHWVKVKAKTNFCLWSFLLLNANIRRFRFNINELNVVNTRTPIAALDGGPRLLGGCCQYTLAEGSLAVHSNDTRCPSRTRSGLGWLICTPRRPESIDKINVHFTSHCLKVLYADNELIENLANQNWWPSNKHNLRKLRFRAVTIQTAWNFIISLNDECFKFLCYHRKNSQTFRYCPRAPVCDPFVNEFM